MFKPTENMLELTRDIKDDVKLSDKVLQEIEDEFKAYMDPKNYESVKCTYFGEPKAQPRARVISNLNTFYDPAKSFKLFLNEHIRSQLGNNFRPIDSELYFTARFYRPYPKTTSKKNKVLMELGIMRPLVKPDLDNYEKLLYDALNGFLYTDDTVIVQGNHQKFYSCKPRVEIEINFRKK